MPEQVKTAQWSVAIDGIDGFPPFVINAAYLQHGIGGTVAGGPTPPDAPLVLKDINHQVVFAAPPSRLLWIRREDAVVEAVAA